MSDVDPYAPIRLSLMEYLARVIDGAPPGATDRLAAARRALLYTCLTPSALPAVLVEIAEASADLGEARALASAAALTPRLLTLIDLTDGAEL